MRRFTIDLLRKRCRNRTLCALAGVESSHLCRRKWSSSMRRFDLSHSVPPHRGVVFIRRLPQHRSWDHRLKTNYSQGQFRAEARLNQWHLQRLNVLPRA